MKERDKYLTEKMGGKSVMCCVVEGDADIDETCVRQPEYDGWVGINDCCYGDEGDKPEECEYWQYRLVGGITDFSIWESFGLLWEWAQDQDWWFNFVTMNFINMTDYATKTIIHPDRFATAVYEFLMERTL